MHVKVEEKEGSSSHDEKKYHTPDSMHPLILQLNVTQVGALLLALMPAYNDGPYGTSVLETAMDIWCQLSDYGKKRMREHFAVLYPELGSFIETIESELSADRYPSFSTEEQMFQEASLEEQLGYAFKSGMPCNIRLKDDPQTYTRVTIGIRGHQRYVIKNAYGDVKGFTMNDIKVFEL